LADIWIQAADRQAVTDAADRIDRALARDADRKGQVFHGRRVLVDAPLAVTFAVSVDDCLVTVSQVDRV
jgi:hypothetical protein